MRRGCLSILCSQSEMSLINSLNWRKREVKTSNQIHHPKLVLPFFACLGTISKIRKDNLIKFILWSYLQTMLLPMDWDKIRLMISMSFCLHWKIIKFQLKTTEQFIWKFCQNSGTQFLHLLRLFQHFNSSPLIAMAQQVVSRVYVLYWSIQNWKNIGLEMLLLIQCLLIILMHPTY